MLPPGVVECYTNTSLLTSTAGTTCQNCLPLACNGTLLLIPQTLAAVVLGASNCARHPKGPLHRSFTLFHVSGYLHGLRQCHDLHAKVQTLNCIPQKRHARATPEVSQAVQARQRGSQCHSLGASGPSGLGATSLHMPRPERVGALQAYAPRVARNETWELASVRLRSQLRQASHEPHEPMKGSPPSKSCHVSRGGVKTQQYPPTHSTVSVCRPCLSRSLMPGAWRTSDAWN